jgi:signal transduction histidine kinase
LSVNIQSLSALLAAIVTFAIGSSVLLRDRRQRPFRRFAMLCFALSAWHITTFLKLMLEWELAHFLSLYAAVLLPLAAMRFFRPFLDDARLERDAGQTPRWMFAVSTALTLAVSYALMFRRFGIQHASPFKLSFLLCILVELYGSMGLVWRKYRSTLAPGEKTSLMYLALGGVVAITLGAAEWLPVVGGAASAFGNIITIIYMYFISQTLFRYRLLDVNEVMGKMVVLSALVLILASVYGVLVAWVPPAYWGVFFFNTLVASFVILILFDPLRSAIEGPIQKWMFRERYELKVRVDALRGMLANVIDIREAVRLILANLDESRRVTHAAVYLVDPDGAGYDLIGHLGPKAAERVDAAARRPFFERIQSARGPISVEQLEREYAQKSALPDGETETIDAIARALAEMNAAICIPLIADEQVLGLLCLKDERMREAYATDEVDLFRGVAAQMAITVQNSKLYDRMKERDRLAALGEMAAGLAHEIRNPLGAIKGAAQLLLPQNADAPAPAETEFLSIIVEEANRLNRVVSQFLDYARPYRGEPQPLDVNEVVRKTAQLVTPPPVGDAAPPPVEVVLSLADELPRARADAEQLRQVFLNLAINAVQAMPTGGKLTISTSVRKGGRRGAPAQFLEVRFRDNGAGIPAAELKNLFIPFYTTKEKGTGLGLPISQRIIENHGGTIEVRSRVGVGSTFTVVLPALDSEARPQEAAAKAS